MPAVDTNVLVRLIVQDDAAQQALARKAIAAVVDAGERVHIPTTVVLELEWVLRSRYRFPREKIEQTVVGLLASGDVDIGNELAVEEAVARYRDGTADFADCLHTALALAAGRAPLLTFDQAAAQVPGARLIGGRPR
jgi:predicted nucleic-acid-binding protein